MSVRLLGAAGVVACVKLGAPLWLAIASTVAAATAGLIGTWMIVIRRGHDLHGRLSRTRTRRLVVRALPLGAVVAVGYLHFEGDSVLLSVLRPPADLGVYSVAFRLIEVLIMLPGLYIAAAFPLLARSRENPERYLRGLQRSLDLLVVTGVPTILGTIVFAPSLIRILGGGALHQAAFTLRVLAVAALFAWFNTLFASVAVIEHLERRLLVVSVVGLSVNVALNCVAIPRYSYNGAAVVTVVTECGGALAVLALALRASGWRPAVTRLAPTFGASAGAALLVIATQGYARLTAPLLYAALCPLLLLLLRAVTPRDLRELLGLQR